MPGASRSDGVELDAYTRSQQAIQMDNDAQAILENKPVIVPGSEGLKDVAIVSPIFESSRTQSPQALELG